MSDIRGGQVWTQERFPFFTCYIVYVAAGESQDWCRIDLPELQGNIAWDTECTGSLYSKEGMQNLLRKGDYICKGQYSNILKAQLEEMFQLGIDRGRRDHVDE